MFEGGLNGDRGGLFERGGFFHLARTMVSVLHKELECKVEKLNYKKLEVTHPNIDSQLVNHPRSVHTKFYSRD